MKWNDFFKKHLIDDRNVLPQCTYWHYTSLNGFTGIVRNNAESYKKLHFWFSRSDCLNDISEGSYVETVFQEVVSQKLSEECSEGKRIFLEKVKLIKLSNKWFIHYNNHKEPDEKDSDDYETVIDLCECDTYICSFSEQADSLDMWRYYSKNDVGISLGFNSVLPWWENEFECHPERPFEYYQCYRVEYDDKIQKSYFSELIDDAYEYLISDDGIRDDNSLKDVLSIITSQLHEKRFVYKHKCFASEKEIRFVYFCPKEKPTNMDVRLPEIQYRVSNGNLIPYIDHELPSCAYASLEKIMVSPFCQDEKTVQIIEDYGKKCGLIATVEQSQLPVRF